MLPNRAAIILAGLVVALILGDVLISGGALIIFIAREFAELIQWIAFWR